MPVKSVTVVGHSNNTSIGLMKREFGHACLKSLNARERGGGGWPGGGLTFRIDRGIISFGFLHRKRKNTKNIDQTKDRTVD